MPIYDFTLHERSAEVRRVEPADVVIVEGILVLHIEEIRSLLNMKIFVDTDDDLRLARRCAAAQADSHRIKVSGLMEAQSGSSVKHSMWLKLRLMARCSQGKHRGLSEASLPWQKVIPLRHACLWCRIQRDVALRGRDIAGVIEQYTKFVKPAFDTFVAPSRKHADIIIPWGRCACPLPVPQSLAPFNL